MNKDKILKKAQQEKEDEMEAYIKDKSIRWVYLAMVFAAAFFSFIRGAQGLPIMDLCATVSISICVGQFYRFMKGKDKGALFIAFLMLAVFIFSTIRFLMGH